MGKGDCKTRRGKIFRGSYGNVRLKPRKQNHRVNEIAMSQKKKKENCKEEKKEWFKPKGYLHFAPSLSSRDKGWVMKIVANKERVAKRNFYPLIYRTIKQRRFKKMKDADGNYYRSHYDKEKKKSTMKIRHIFYANHLDAAIYSYYAKEILSPIYEEKLKCAGIDDCISAYRRIKISDKSNKGKSNIHFAKDIFDFIKTKGDCVAMAFDIEGFFDNLSHEHIKNCWSELIGEKEGYLPEDHLRIFNSLVNFSYVYENQLLKKFDLIKYKNKKKRKEKSNKLGGFYKGKTKEQRGRYFREEICKKGLLKYHEEYEKEIVNGKNKGIPQGLPISAFLANLYLFQYDIEIQKLAKQYNGIYRRYSDDILIVCDQGNEQVIENKLVELLKAPPYNLIIHTAPEKKEIVTYYRKPNKELAAKENKTLKYLGFEFDSKRVLVKSSALSKYHRRRKQHIKTRIRLARRYEVYSGKAQKVWNSVVIKKYIDGKGRNFVSYINRSAEVMDEKKIFKQVRKRRQQTNRYLRRRIVT